jgi:hypothetical protein
LGSLPVDHESQTELLRHSHMHSSRQCGGMMPRFVGFRTTVSHFSTAVVETHLMGKLELGWGTHIPDPNPAAFTMLTLGGSPRLQWPPAASVRGRPWGLFLPSLAKHPIDGGVVARGCGDRRPGMSDFNRRATLT